MAAAARQVWDDFSGLIRNPLGDEHTVATDTTTDSITGIAMARPVHARSPFGLPDRAVILLSERLLRTASHDERRLSLLHECIHLDFAFGAHRDRWMRRLRRASDAQSSARQMPLDTEVERQRYEDIDRRQTLAFQIFSLPDEIFAEQRLKQDYAEWFERRAAYYVSMRQSHEADVVAGRPDDVLWPFQVFSELIRIEFFRRLVVDLPVSARELDRLAALTAQSLRTCASADLFVFLNELRPQLLDVTLDTPIATFEAVYERLFERVNETEAVDECPS